MSTTFLTSFTHNVVAAAEGAAAKFKADLVAAEAHFKNIEAHVASGLNAVHAYEVRIVASDEAHIATLKADIAAFLDKFKGHPAAISVSTVEHKPITAPAVAPAPTPAPVVAEAKVEVAAPTPAPEAITTVLKANGTVDMDKLTALEKEVVAEGGKATPEQQALLTQGFTTLQSEDAYGAANNPSSPAYVAPVVAPKTT